MASLAARPLYHRCALGRRLDETAVVVGPVGTWKKIFPAPGTVPNFLSVVSPFYV